ncbi:NUDIX domain-containing protein [soil metagenome]
MFKNVNGQVEIFLVHPGGPFFKNKDLGWWTIPKGLDEEDESLLETAIREFKEETGLTPSGPYIELGNVKQKGGKTVHAWAFEGEWDPASGFTCNYFQMEWPPKSSKFKSFPEIDAAQWIPLNEALLKINQQQKIFLERLMEKI